MHSAAKIAFLLSSLALASCHGRERAQVIIDPPTHRPVSILVEVYDPATNFVWQDVSVRVVEASHEWSGCTCVSPFDDWLLTDEFGQVLIDEFILRDADVGFVESGGAAFIGPDRREDEATVLLMVDAVGFTPQFVEVDLSWDNPDVFIEVPFN